MEIQMIETKKVLKIEYAPSKKKSNNSWCMLELSTRRFINKPFTLDECYELYKHESDYDYEKCTDAPPQPPPTAVQNVDKDDDEAQYVEKEDDTPTKKQRGPVKKKLKAQKQAQYLDGTSSDSLDSVESSEKLLAYFKGQDRALSLQLKEENEMLENAGKIN
ncbi:hypothetical protein C5167_034364 [Papaver somniferum]|uniref:Uncharacterized protein n=1 Tax=Papaver somniferum TaxID=3469 RepID=A0A4Y7KGJ8_PAPSO|nr:hypothetical protein C5167_034364 [Papaver somniferum]